MRNARIEQPQVARISEWNAIHETSFRWRSQSLGDGSDTAEDAEEIALKIDYKMSRRIFLVCPSQVP